VPFVLLIGGSVKWDDGKSGRRGKGKKFDCLMIWKINIKRLTSTLILLPIRPSAVGRETMERSRAQQRCFKFLFSKRIVRINLHWELPSSWVAWEREKEKNLIIVHDFGKIILDIPRFLHGRTIHAFQSDRVNLKLRCCVLLAECENNPEEIN
jgi:hypothetical protein